MRERTIYHSKRRLKTANRQINKRYIYRVVTIIVIALTTTICTAGNSPSEYELKAAYIYNFAKFVEWPSDTFSSSSSPIIIGIVGDDPFGRALEDAVAGKTANDRKLEIKRFKNASELRKCHILFVCDSEERRIAAIVKEVAVWNTLTVSDIQSFAERGGIIEFINKNNKVRIEINNDNAKRNGLRISSKLLKLADIV